MSCKWNDNSYRVTDMVKQGERGRGREGRRVKRYDRWERKMQQKTSKVQQSYI